MAETTSEKLLKDTINKLKKEGKIINGNKYFQQVRGQFRTKAPMDFYIVDNDYHTHNIEVKEKGGITLPYSHFKDEQRRLLNHGIDNYTKYWLLIRFFSSDYNRNNAHYFERYFLCDGRIAPDMGDSGSISMNDLLENEMVIEIASRMQGATKGIVEDAGLTTRENPTEGFSMFLKFLTQFEELKG